MAYTRITAVWSGVSGLPGYSRFHFDGDLGVGDSANAGHAVRALFTNIRDYLPLAVSINLSNIAEHFDITGNLIGQVDWGSEGPETGLSAGAFSAATGACITWLTGAFANGRGVRGRTFLVPLGSNAFQSDGTLGTIPLGVIQGAGNALCHGDLPMVVVTNAAGPIVGLSAITNATVRDSAAVLKSRRD